VTIEQDIDASRRTELAAERTWLAWWRSGIAAATAAIAVGGVVPHLVGGHRTPYIVLGAGYAGLAIATFAGAAVRQRRLQQQPDEGRFEPASVAWIAGLTLAGMTLALATLVLVIVQP
jgi:inner membrane protein YidH